MERISYDDQLYLDFLSFALCRIEFAPIVSEVRDYGYVNRNSSEEELDRFLDMTKQLINDEAYVVGLCAEMSKAKRLCPESFELPNN